MKLKKVVIGLSLLSISVFSIAQMNAVDEKKQAVVKPEVSVFEGKSNNQLPGIDAKTEQIVEMVPGKQEKTEANTVSPESEKAAFLPASNVSSSDVMNKDVITGSDELSIEDLSGSEDPLVKQELESIKKLFVDLNQVFSKKQSDKLSSFFTEKFIFIQSDQAIYRDFDSLAKYFFEKTKFEGFVDFSEIMLQDKIMSSISFDGLNAHLIGKASEKYLVGDTSYSVPLRWTATLEKVDNNWKIKSIHFGADHLGNQILASYESFGIKLGIVALFVGLILGMLLAGMLLRIVKK